MDKIESRLATLAVIWADEKSKRKIPPPIVVTHPDRPEAAKAPKKTVGPAGVAKLFGGR